MTTITIEQAGKYDGQKSPLKGWLYNLRESGNCLFRFLGWHGIIQGVWCAEGKSGGVRIAEGLTAGVERHRYRQDTAEKRAAGGFEIGVTKIKSSRRFGEHPFPIQLKEHGVDFLLINRHLWIF